ncbi:MAG: hypothetical protein J0M00_02550 [Burkholderiales bacterium]|nr:hypothetical protein [Burkholderiales bacterium]
MIIDLTGLSGVDAQWRKAWELADLPEKAEPLGGPLTGTLWLGGPSPFRIDGGLVEKLRPVRSGPVVELKLPTPVPGYETADVRLTLRYDPDAGEWKTGMPGRGWFEKKDAILGRLGWWMTQKNEEPFIELKISGGRGFPLQNTGVAQEMHWAYSNKHYLYAGVFVEAGRAWLVLVPTSESGPKNDASAGLRLAGLTRTKFGVNEAYNAVPLMLALPLAAAHSLWRAVVQWDPMNEHKSAQRLMARPVIEQAWNFTVQHAAAGTRVQRSGQPVTGLPWLDLQNAAAVKEVRPLLVFDITAPDADPRKARAKLRGLHLARSAPVPILAVFGWQPAGTAGAPWTPDKPWPLHEDALVFTGELDGSATPSAWSAVPFQGDLSWAERIASASAALDKSAELLASWHVKREKGRVARQVGKDEWLVWGALEFRIPAGCQAELQCRLRGTWTETHADLYPDAVLEVFGCEVRTSQTGDVAGQDLEAAFGVSDSAEDELQRDSDPLRFPRRARSAGRKCNLRISHLTTPGRNAVLRLEVRAEDRRPIGEESVFLQVRPFFVGVVQPADIDAEAGLLIATWASNDPEGAQWRVPDATVSVTFQPQAVGEAMERGARFWTKDGKPWLDPSGPVAYRFSPPTQIVVRPSVRERRYNKSPSNLAAVFTLAKVESFTTEMVYPVEAKFEVSHQGLPDVRVAETASMLGRPAENLERLPDADDPMLKRWIRVAFSGEAAAYAVDRDSALHEPLKDLRSAHSAARSGFSARLAQFHLYDPWSAQGGLGLKEGLRFRIRDRNAGAPPLANPLPQWKKEYGQDPEVVLTDLSPAKMQEIAAGGWAFLADKGAWGEGGDSIPAGVVHTIEFASELVAVLRAPVATGGEIESLALSALGASGRMSVSFDEGRTTFIAETNFGQLSRLIKVRIGRVGVLWNKAKHVVVYERSTVASKQFEDEQEWGAAKPGEAGSLRGWPVLRKTEEYVEAVEMLRHFEREEQKDENRAGFLVASEFVTPRVYVNGAWGRDLEHGYEIPLWNAEDKSGFYPKPFFALQARAGGEQISRCWHEEPQHLVFYSNTQAGTGPNPDKWEAQPGVDCAEVLARLPLLTAAGISNNEALASPSLPAPRPGLTRRPRFDMAVRSDGKVDLQHGRGDTHMLATMDLVSVARTAVLGPAGIDALKAAAQTEMQALLASSEAGARIESAASLRSRAEALIARTTEQLLRTGADCVALKGRLNAGIDELFLNAKEQLRKAVAGLPQAPVIPAGALPFTSALDEARTQLLRREDVLRAPFDKIRADLEAARVAARQDGEEAAKAAKQQLMAARDMLKALARSQNDQMQKYAASLLELDTGKKVGDAKEQLSAAVTSLQAALKEAKVEFEKKVPDFEAAERACTIARAQIAKLRSHATVGGLARQLDSAVGMLAGFLKDANNRAAELEDAWTNAAAAVKTATAQAQAIVDEIALAVGALETQMNALRDSLRDAVTEKIDELLGLALKAFDAAETEVDAKLADALGFVDKIHDAPSAAAGQAANDVIAKWTDAVKTAVGETSGLRIAAGKVDAEFQKLASAAVGLAKSLVAAIDNASDSVTTWLDQLHKECVDLVDTIDCEKAQEIAGKLRNALKKAEDELRERVAEQAGKIFDEETRQQLAALEDKAKGIKEYADQAGQAIKLVKAIGELPELPTLTFNADRAEYLFDDAKKQIETSPFAAKLREIDSGLKQLGIAVPARELLDQIVPDSLRDLDFNKVFRNIGGLDFEGLFQRFKLPNLGSNNIKITQGVDKATRSAWVTTKVRADFKEQQSLFEFSGLMVTVAEMKLRADSDMRIRADGQRTSSTDALLQGDWGLHFGGASLAKFREVSVRYDGSGFEFDIEPKKIELHPALKFVDEFAKRFAPELPPAVELEKDSRGIPVGARATMTTEIKDLPPLGVVSIGPLKIVSGLGLRMNTSGQFVVNAFVSVGTKTSPVWVQIGYLGGGMWLEAQAKYEGKVTYSATVGLSIGSQKALNIAHVARGSYALLLFAYADITDSGGSLRVGFSLSGSARILGMANASVLLLLEAVHGGGETKGNGVLDVKVDICWCYTLKVRRDVQHQIA